MSSPVVDPSEGGLSLEFTAIEARRAALRGDVAEAERFHAMRFARAHAEGDAALARAFVDYAQFCLEGAREFEALASAGRAEALFLGLGDPSGMALARLHRGAVVQALRDWVRLPAAIESVEALRPRLTERVRRIAEPALDFARANLAGAHGRYEDARRLLEEARARPRESGLEPASCFDPRAAELLEIRWSVAQGRFDEAIARADARLHAGRTDDATVLALRGARLAAQAGRGTDGVEAAASALLDGCAHPDPSCRPGHVREIAMGVAHVLGAMPSAARTMRRAFEVAAVAAFARAVEVDRFVHRLPEAAELCAEDAETLSDHRRATRAEQDALGAAVVIALERAAEAGLSPLPMFGDAHGLTCVCAWCRRVRTRDGIWLTVEQFLPLRSAGSVHLSHGACETCAPALLADAATVPG